MKNIELTNEQLENMSYADVAHLVLKDKGKKMTIQDIFLQVIKIMKLPDEYFENKIGDFFGLLSTDKRFIMLDKGYWDLKDNHINKVILDEEEDEEIISLEETPEETEEDEEVNYDDDSVEDDEEEDDLKDFVIVDEEMEEM